MTQRNLTLTIANPILKLLLRSPLHGAVSQQIMLITVTGRKSGKPYTTPVNYIQENDRLHVVSHQHRTWWRNLHPHGPVIVHLRGQKLAASGYAFTDSKEVAPRLFRYLQEVSHYAEPLGIGLDEEGQPLREEVNEACTGKVMVEIHL